MIREIFHKSVVLSLLLISLSAAPASAGNAPAHGPRPYGGYCMGNRWGWYGARTPVNTMEEAKRHFEKYFEGRDVVVGTIVDKGNFFRAEITDTKKNIVDYVIIDKRTGRIRSLY